MDNTSQFNEVSRDIITPGKHFLPYKLPHNPTTTIITHHSTTESFTHPISHLFITCLDLQTALNVLLVDNDI
jgi:hypothetical protein